MSISAIGLWVARGQANEAIMYFVFPLFGLMEGIVVGILTSPFFYWMMRKRRIGSGLLACYGIGSIFMLICVEMSVQFQESGYVLLCYIGPMIVAVVIAKSDWLKADVDDNAICPKCDYDLRGAEHEACPECGSPVSRECQS